MNDIQAVIWDLGGVLVRTEDPAPRQSLAARFGLERRELEELVFNSEPGVKAQLGQISEDQLWAFVLDHLGEPLGEAGVFEQAFWGGDRVDESLVGYISRLRPRFTTALLSNAWSTLRRAMEDKLQISDVFDELVISAEVGLMKPDARIYRLALEKIRIQPAEAVFLDDQPVNVEGARALGMHAIQFRQPTQALEALSALIDPI
jgi:epoxide hydrolase-like predicted phosphatase